MKSVNAKAMSFGFGVVNSGQRNTVIEPQVIATSTEGGFRITPLVSRVLGVANGENVMFVNNLAQLDEAIAAKDTTLTDFVAESGLEWGTPEAAIAIHHEFDMWGIAKGVLEKDTKGNIKTCTERLSKNDKLRFVSQNFEEALAGAMNQADDDTKAALSRDGITQNEQAEILTAFVTPRELPKYMGSKTSNPAGLTGVGTTLNFTDSNIWKQLKADLGESAGEVNRVFDVDVEHLVDAPISNGFETVNVKVLVLGQYVDKKPARIGKNDEDSAE